MKSVYFHTHPAVSEGSPLWCQCTAMPDIVIIMIACKRWWVAESIQCARRLHKAAPDGSQWAPHHWQTAAERLWTLLSEVTIVFLAIEREESNDSK